MVKCLRIALWLAVMMLATSPQLPAGTSEQGPLDVRCADADKALAGEAADVLKTAIAEFGQRLPAGHEPIHLVICSTREEFARFAGWYAQESVGGIAQPENGLIAVKAPSIAPESFDFPGTLRHELLHVLLARNVNTDNLPRWLNEGICMTLAKEHRWGATYHVATMYLRGELIPYRDLLTVFLDPGKEMQFGDAYAQGLSMTHYLMDRLGQDRFWAMLRDLDAITFVQAMEKHAGMTPAQFWEAWRDSLWVYGLLFLLVSGFGAFQVMALLVLAAYVRKRRAGRAILKRWEDEEREQHGPPYLFPWELEDTEPERPWEEDEKD